MRGSKQAHDANTALEAMIDKHGLASVVESLATICGEKAEHLATNWPESTSARNYWNACAKKLSALTLRGGWEG